MTNWWKWVNEPVEYLEVKDALIAFIGGSLVGVVLGSLARWLLA